ncbi:hypothetical protein A0H81_06425 [Grifola frondosa]|uniref:Uncharacterized protein n=1 Tax=Grifola frondosa TaxID=5627 RepID=A0A1C7MA58_GRIFR|nr:hypothetical protein A0H81_06425 [Grifola frondosa]
MHFVWQYIALGRRLTEDIRECRGERGGFRSRLFEDENKTKEVETLGTVSSGIDNLRLELIEVELSRGNVKLKPV